MSVHETLSVYDYSNHKICDLYDSHVELIGQAYDIVVTKEFNGTQTLTFKIPYMMPNESGADELDGALYGIAVYGRDRFSEAIRRMGNKNFRWLFLKSDYLIRYTCGSTNTWFVANKPTKYKTNKTIYGDVSCYGYETLLKTRNIYMVFDDENGIGTISYIIGQILRGTGWTFDSDHSDTLYERDGTTEKIRSLKSDGKKGALDLIITTCNLFKARPIFDTDAKTVTIKSINNREQVLEGEVGRNLTALSVSNDSSDMATRLYVEGEYGDYGYVGIDDVIVDGEPYGLPFIINFDYYRELGLFTQEHELALTDYLTNIKAIKSAIRVNGTLLINTDDAINTLIGQCKLAVYYKNESLVTPKWTYGGITDEQATLNVGDNVYILLENGKYECVEWSGLGQLSSAYGVAKFATPSAGKIGAAEVQVESKQKSIEQLQRKINVTVKPDKIAEYQAEIDRLNAEISTLYNDEETGLYVMMDSVMRSNGLLYDYNYYYSENERLNGEQDDIEATFIAAMGYMLRDGYWNDKNYTVGQEEYLYADAMDMSREMSRPKTTYSFSFIRVQEDFGIPAEDFEINGIFKLYDKELEIDDKLYISKLSYGVDNKSAGSIEVSNQDITLTGNDLGSLLSRMSQLADLIDQKNALYERAKAINSEGSMYVSRLEGQIDVVKNKILSSVSNWYTDENGNIVFLSADGSSAMMLSGAGFMLANSKTDSGDWNWRTLGDGTGITADEIVAGFISADRIEAGTISTAKVTSDFGQSLMLSSSQYIQLSTTDFDSLGSAESGIYLSPTAVKVNSGGTFELHATNLDISTDGTVSASNLALNGGTITLKDGNTTKFSVTNKGYLTSVSGTIGGWTIADTTLTGNKTGLATTTNDTDVAIWAGNATAGSAAFRVTQGGKLYASGAEISGSSTFSGTMSANCITSGTLSANYISGGSIDASNVTITNLNASNISTGTMSASKISGGTLTLGGNNNGNGTISIKNASNTEIGKWNNAGITATAGTIGGWSIADKRLSSGSGTNTVALDSGTTGMDYAIWAGNGTAASAPFRVKRDGTVYVTSLNTVTESGGTQTVDLSNYPLWKLSYSTVKSSTETSITLSNGTTINFNTAASVDFYSESLWSSGNKTLTLTNGRTKTVSIPDATSWSSTYIGNKEQAVSALVGGKSISGTIGVSDAYNDGWNSCKADIVATKQTKYLYEGGNYYTVLYTSNDGQTVTGAVYRCRSGMTGQSYDLYTIQS